MVVTVSTVWEELGLVERWVQHNLASGVDHMLVFLDRPHQPGQAEVREFLEAHPHVTVVAAGPQWWAGKRPRNLNYRQSIHANVAAVLLAEAPEVEWVFHIDVDEVAHVDRTVLAQVPHHEVAVVLETLEAVSTYDGEGWETRFKSIPDENLLHLLFTLGTIPKPKMGGLIHGHTRGKSGIRTGRGVQLGVHSATVRETGEPAPAYRHPKLRLLHHYSTSGAQLQEKVARYVAAGDMSMGSRKERMIRSVLGLDALGLPPEQYRALHRRVYGALLADRVEELEELGLLTHIDAGAGTHRPRLLPARAKERLERGLEQLRGADKSPFDPYPEGYTHHTAISFEAPD